MKRSKKSTSPGCMVALLVMVLGYASGFVLSKHAALFHTQNALQTVSMSMPPLAPILYHVEVKTGVQPHLDVSITLSSITPHNPVRFQMPTWCPGEYRLQNFAHYVYDVQASDGKKAILIDANTWEVDAGDQSSLSLTYKVAPSPAGYFTENLCVAGNWAFINGPAAFMSVAGHRNDPISLQVQTPDGWHTASPLDPAKTLDMYTAPDYDTLVDSPLALGQLTRFYFKIQGVPHEVVAFRHPGQLNPGAFAAQLTPLLETEIKRFGKIPPYKRYLFFVDAGGEGGGLEHTNACRLGYHTGMDVASLVRLSAHEFFHVWNIKRIRPESLTPIDYIHPPRTNNLWFAEGVTEYYAQRSLLEAGVISADTYLHDISNQIQRFRASNGSRFTADESSQYVWEAGNSRGYGGMSFYNRGYLIGLCLDLKIRTLTNGEKSLDDVMRLLNSPDRCEEGVSENGIRDAINQVAGKDLTPFYHRLCRSTEALPIEACLSFAGLTLRAQGNLTRLSEISLDQRTLRRDWLYSL